MRKRVVFVTPVLAPYWVRRLESLAKCSEIELHVLLESEFFPERPGWVSVPIDSCNVQITKSIKKVKCVYDDTLGYKEKYTKALPYGLSYSILRLNPDAVILCNPTQILFVLPARVRKKLRLGLILEDTLSSQMKKGSVIRFLRRLLYAQVDFIFFFSEEARRYADLLRLRGRQYRSSWSIDSKWLSCERKKSQLLPLRFLFVGQLIERKGILPMLHGWKRFAAGQDNLQLLLVGDGPLKGDIVKYCDKHNLSNVFVTGQLPYAEVRNYYLTSDVFILPTMEDLYSLVVLEAMAFGLPIMTTIYNGAKELVLNGHNGNIFDPTSVDSIVAAFEEITAHSVRIAQMGKNSRAIISDYTHEKVMTRMGQDLIRELS